MAYQLNSLFIFMMLFLFNVQLRNKYDDDDDDVLARAQTMISTMELNACIWLSSMEVHKFD